MKVMKKLILSLSIVVTMAIAFVIGCVGHSSPQTSNYCGGTINNTESSTKVDTPTKVEKPTTYTYAPNEIMVCKGASTLNYTYTPSVDMKDTASTIAYEYCFANPMNRATAVNLKSIDTTGVNVSYYCSSTKMDTNQSITGETKFTLQEMSNKGDQVYIYVIVSPTNESIPTTFTTSIVWYYGIPKEVSIIDNITNSVIDTQTIVSGQKIDSETLTAPADFVRMEKDPNGNDIEVKYYFDAWFYDKNFTQIVSGVNTCDNKMYARYHNIPLLSTEFMKYNNGEYSLGGCYNGSSETYILPIYNFLAVPTYYDDGVNGVAPVTQIRTSAFGDSVGGGGSGINGISLPYTLTTIGDDAFACCSNLKNVDLSGCINLTAISEDAFCWCTSLTNITLPNSVTSIGKNTFSSCSSLTNITIPNSVTSIGNGTFYRCSSLTSIVVESGNSVYDSRNNCNAIIETATNTLIQGCSNTIIPDDIEVIGDSAFSYCGGLTDISISSCVTSIGNYAFQTCMELTSIIIPSSVTSIGSYAFGSCYALAEIYNLSGLTITLGNTSGTNGCLGQYAKVIHTSLSEISRIQTIDNVQYYVHEDDFIALAPVNRNATSITIDSRTTSIMNYAFNSCGSLTNVDLRNCTNLTTIGSYAFQVCRSLTSIVIPSSITKIGGYAFSWCGITSLTFESGGTWYYGTQTEQEAMSGGIEYTITAGTDYSTAFESTYRGEYWYKA